MRRKQAMHDKKARGNHFHKAISDASSYLFLQTWRDRPINSDIYSARNFDDLSFILSFQFCGQIYPQFLKLKNRPDLKI